MLCRSVDLKPRKMLTSRLFGVDVVGFRDASGQPHVLKDRCPHRNVPLSFGRYDGSQLRCGYHGWTFSPAGACTSVPGLPPSAATPEACIPAYAAVESQGFVWVWATADAPPEDAPFQFRCVDDPDYLVVRKSLSSPGTVGMVAENALDVPHTAFLHGGLFRRDRDRSPVTCKVTTGGDYTEVSFEGERRPSGLAGWLLSPSGGEVQHVDRFELPCLVVVEYRIGTENHLMLQGALTPVDDETTVMHACVAVRTRFPKWLVRPVIQPVALHIFGQDQTILRHQMDARIRDGEVRDVSTALDLLGPTIERLLRRAAAGGQGARDTKTRTRTTEMWL